MTDGQAFRQAWGKFVTGVSVVTVCQPDGEVHGMTANGINSVSMDPMLVLVCVGNDRSFYPSINGSERFAISILSEEQQSISEYHARPKEKQEEASPGSFRATERGAAVLDHCLAFMDCRIVDRHAAGDHTIFIGEVEQIQVNSGKPLMFFEGGYCRFS